MYCVYTNYKSKQIASGNSSYTQSSNNIEENSSIYI